MVHEKFGVCCDPPFSIKAQPTPCDNKVNMGMLFHVSAKGVNNNEDAHAHSLDVPSPLPYGFSGSMN